MELAWSPDVSRRPSSENMIKMLNSAVSFKKSVLDTVMEAVDEYMTVIEERLER